MLEFNQNFPFFFLLNVSYFFKLIWLPPKNKTVDHDITTVVRVFGAITIPESIHTPLADFVQKWI